MAKDYNISKTAGHCSLCEKQFAPGEEFIATVKDVSQELQRDDYCMSCWQDGQSRQQDAPSLLGVWQSRTPRPQEKKRLFVDDDLLINFFHRLEGAQQAAEQAKVNFRFVLALILMRKKLLVYDRSEKGCDGLDVWTMHFKGCDGTHQVIDPHMDEEKIAQVSQQLGEILECEI